MLLKEVCGDLSQRKVGDLLNKSPALINRYMNGTAVPPDDVLLDLAKKRNALESLGKLLTLAARERVGQVNYASDDDRKLALDAFDAQIQASLDVAPAAPKSSGRTFRYFPESFYPMVIVCGDKREVRGQFLSHADIGAFTPTPADTRWIANLELRHDVVKHVDKNFILRDEDDLIEEFAETNILCIGSHAANHLARRVNRKSVFHFAYEPRYEAQIEMEVQQASALSRDEITVFQQKEKHRIQRLIDATFSGGIFDPTDPNYVNASRIDSLMPGRYTYDWGVLTFAVQPYYAAKCKREGIPNDHRYVAILAAGIRHPGTSHAMRLLGRYGKDENVFERYPYGGIIRVRLDTQFPFHSRTLKAKWKWETDIAIDAGRTVEGDQRMVLLNNLAEIEKKIRAGDLAYLSVEADDVRACREVIESL